MKQYAHVVFLVVCLAACLSTGKAWAEWYTLETKYLELRYQNIKDLKKFNRKIDYSTGSGSFFGFFGGKKSSEESFDKELADKLDALFEKVQMILDMRESVKIRVNIYNNKKSLHEAYFKIYKKEKNLRAWYIFEYNTIYLNVEDVHAQMLAHECAHAIVDNYMEVRPPRATAEILARYVDAHLNRQAKTY